LCVDAQTSTILTYLTSRYKYKHNPTN